MTDCEHGPVVSGKSRPQLKMHGLVFGQDRVCDLQSEAKQSSVQADPEQSKGGATAMATGPRRSTLHRMQRSNAVIRQTGRVA